MNSGLVCDVCSGTNFYEDNGNFWCGECQTMSQCVTVMMDERDQVAEVNEDICLDQNNLSTTQQPGSDKVLTSFELLTKILRGLATELIELGVSPSLLRISKILWLNYLKKLGIILNDYNCPLLPACFKTRDVEILYGVPGLTRRKLITGKNRNVKKRRTKSPESLSRSRRHKKRMQQLITDQFESNADESATEQSIITTPSVSDFGYETEEDLIKDIKMVEGASRFFKAGRKLYVRDDKNRRRLLPTVNAHSSLERKRMQLNVIDVLTILRLALMYTRRNIQLGDLYRLASDGHFLIENLERFVPSQYRNYITLQYNTNGLSRGAMQFRMTSTCVELGIKRIKIPDLKSLIQRYVVELQLPIEILAFIYKIMDHVLLPQWEHDLTPFIKFVPEFDLIAMAYIIVTLKLCFGLDDATEEDLSTLAGVMNKGSSENAPNKKQFEFTKWLEYLECRNAVVSEFHNISFENTYKRTVNYKIAAQVNAKHKAGRAMKRTTIGVREKAIRNTFIPALNEIAGDPIPPQIEPPLCLDEPYYVEWTKKLLFNHLDKISPPARNILMQDFTTTSLDYLNPKKCKPMLKQLNMKFKKHKGRSKRSVLCSNFSIEGYIKPQKLYKKPSEQIQVPVFNERIIREEISTVDEKLEMKLQSQIKKSEFEYKDDNIILYLPKYEYWTMHSMAYDSLHGSNYKYNYKRTKQIVQSIYSTCPNNFITVLDICSNIIKSQGIHLYATVCRLEQVLLDDNSDKLLVASTVNSNSAKQPN